MIKNFDKSKVFNEIDKMCHFEHCMTKINMYQRWLFCNRNNMLSSKILITYAIVMHPNRLQRQSWVRLILLYKEKLWLVIIITFMKFSSYLKLNQCTNTSVYKEALQQLQAKASNRIQVYRSILWPLMPWLISSPAYQAKLYWLHKIGEILHPHEKVFGPVSHFLSENESNF